MTCRLGCNYNSFCFPFHFDYTRVTLVLFCTAVHSSSNFCRQCNYFIVFLLIKHPLFLLFVDCTLVAFKTKCIQCEVICNTGIVQGPLGLPQFLHQSARSNLPEVFHLFYDNAQLISSSSLNVLGVSFSPIYLSSLKACILPSWQHATFDKLFFPTPVVSNSLMQELTGTQLVDSGTLYLHPPLPFTLTYPPTNATCLDVSNVIGTILDFFYFYLITSGNTERASSL